MDSSNICTTEFSPAPRHAAEASPTLCCKRSSQQIEAGTNAEGKRTDLITCSIGSQLPQRLGTGVSATCSNRDTAPRGDLAKRTAPLSTQWQSLLINRGAFSRVEAFGLLVSFGKRHACQGAMVRTGFHDFGVGATDGSREDAGGAAGVHRLALRCAAVPVCSITPCLLDTWRVCAVAQTNAATPDVGSTLFEILTAVFTWSTRDRSLPKRASASISSTSPT